jgi:hypothetical protein
MKNNSLKRYMTDISKKRALTSLYDLIQAVSDEVEPNEDKLIPETIQHLFYSGQARFMDCSTEVCNSV